MAGEYPGDKDDSKAKEKLRRTVEAGVTSFLDLTEAGEYGLKPYASFLPAASPSGKEIEYRRLPIRDTTVPEKWEMKQILDEIRNSLAQGHIVYMHCWGGVGRTGTVIGCWLRRSGLTGEQALNQVAQCWRAMSEEKLLRHPESPEFEAQK
jgi:hypothetical protein